MLHPAGSTLTSHRTTANLGLETSRIGPETREGVPCLTTRWGRQPKR